MCALLFAMLVDPAHAGTVELSFSTPFSTDPVPVETLTVGQEFPVQQAGPTTTLGPLTVRTVELTRKRDALSAELQRANLRQTALGTVTATFTPDTGPASVLTLSDVVIQSHTIVESADPRAAEKLTLTTTALTWSSTP